MIKRFILPFFGLLLLSISAFAASPRSWHRTGTATGTAASITVGGSATPFGPASICVRNTDATNNLIFAINQTAVIASDAEGILLTIASPEKCIAFSSQNVSNTMTISLIAAAGTATFMVNAVASR